MRKPSSQLGLSLLELIVAMVISLLVLAGVYKIFQGNSETYQMQEAISRTQENGRFAMQFLATDLRMAGYYGCLSTSLDVMNDLNTSAFLYDFDNPIQGFDANGTDWAPALDSSISDKSPLHGSDIIAIRRTIGESGFLSSTMGSDTDNCEVDNHSLFDLNSTVLISDCQGSSIFQVTGKSGSQLEHSNSTAFSPGNVHASLHHAYPEDAELLNIRTITYFIKDNTNGHPALYRKEGEKMIEELVEGVENIQIEYGRDTDDDGSVDSYGAAAAIGDWKQVRSVRIGMVLQSVRELAKQDKDTSLYQLPGTTYDPVDDKRIRRTVIATIGLRNRLH